MPSGRFIRVLQKDIVTKPEQWKDAEPGKFILLSNKAKNVYSVLSVIAFSTAGNAEGKIVKKVGKLGKGWFWTSHAILQQLTGQCQKTVQRAIKELNEEGFIDYHPAKKQEHQCFFKIKKIRYNYPQEDYHGSGVKPKAVQDQKSSIRSKDRVETAQKKVMKKKMIPKRSIEIPYFEEGVLFQRGEDTHNAEGRVIDKDGKETWDVPFIDAEVTMEQEGEEAFLLSVLKNNIENHLTAEYREKLEALKQRLKS